MLVKCEKEEFILKRIQKKKTATKQDKHINDVR